MLLKVLIVTDSNNPQIIFYQDSVTVILFVCLKHGPNKTGTCMCDNDVHSSGRPYGGVAIVCRIIDGITYEPLKCTSPNVTGILLKDNNGIPIQVIVCVYMPYYDKSKPEQTDKYVECINELQCITDDYGDGVPIKILGDLNAQLPSRVCS